jgi:hypothetical protein
MTKEEFKQHCILQANWWIAYATTNHNLNRRVHIGGLDGRLLTAPELVDNAMQTAQNHIRLYRETCDGTGPQ